VRARVARGGSVPARSRTCVAPMRHWTFAVHSARSFDNVYAKWAYSLPRWCSRPPRRLHVPGAFLRDLAQTPQIWVTPILLIFG